MSRRKQRIPASQQKGIIRISLHNNIHWRNFTLQKGHFFGETEDGIYFVSGLEKGYGKSVKVYLCDTSTGDYVWKAQYFTSQNPLVKAILAAVPERKRLGIEKVELIRKPFMESSTGYNPNITTSEYLPYTHVHIPSAGRQTKTGYIMRDNKQVAIKSYC